MPEQQKIDLNAIGARLKILRGDLTIDVFADLLGIHKNTYRNYEKGDRPFGIDVMTELTNLGVNPMWVLKGEGDIMLHNDLYVISDDYSEQQWQFLAHVRSLSKNIKSKIKNKQIKEKSTTYNEWDHDYEERDLRSLSDPEKGSKILDPTCGSGRMSDSFAHIPLYDVKASAGNGVTVNTEDAIDSLAFKNEWIHNELHVNPAHLYLIYVEGESMVPSLRPGDVILVDHSDNTAKRDGIYVLRMDGALLVKRLQRLPGGIIKVGSDNPIYDPFEINLSKIGDEVSIIGRVVWTGRRL